MFAKLLYLMLVSLHCNSLITVNDTEIFVCINDTPLLNVTFLYVSKYTDDNIFSRNFYLQEQKVPGDECSMERKFHFMELSCLGTKVLRDESSIIPQIHSCRRLYSSASTGPPQFLTSLRSCDVFQYCVAWPMFILAYAYFLFQLGAHGCPPMKCTRAPQNLAMLLNPALLHTPIVGVYWCLPGSNKFPDEHQNWIWANLFISRGSADLEALFKDKRLWMSISFLINYDQLRYMIISLMISLIT